MEKKEALFTVGEIADMPNPYKNSTEYSQSTKNTSTR